MKITTTKFNKENSVKHFKNNIKFLAPLSLVLSLSLSPLSAEEDGGFMTFGYELGQVVQSVKNPGKIRAINLASELNAETTNNLPGNNEGGNIVALLGNMMANYIQTVPAAYLRIKEGTPNTTWADGTPYQQYTQQVNTTINALEALSSNAYKTNYPNLAKETSYINSFVTYVDFINQWQKQNCYLTSCTGGLPYVQSQTDKVKDVNNTFINNILQLQLFNSANAGNELPQKEFTHLVQNIIDSSQKTLDAIKDAEINPAKIQESNAKANVEATSKQLPSYTTNVQNTIDKLQRLNNAIVNNPYLAQFAAGNSKQTNSMSGFYTKIGYKQFFGKKKAFGLRYYGFFSYNGAGVGNGSTYNQVNLLTYGVGTDALYNVFSRSFGSRSIDAGFFTGIQLAGDSYITSLAKNSQLVHKPTATKFQFLFDVGMRMNFGILKKDMKKHNQHSIEIGVQIPTIYNTYYSSGGTEVKYYRPYSVYWVYGYAF
ncbi:outer membrane protein [Helicobacter cetorum]|uniref:outer membrane protein n=1 Tax=Helicobacter cetorum TaxID=138563 RepID=UPI000CF0656E|nr:outer membrane protein [Helicobacter cetorum]